MAIIRTQVVLDVATLVWDDTAMSGTAKRVTEPLDLLDVSEHASQRPINEVAYLIDWTNDAVVVGTFEIEVSNLAAGPFVSAASLGINNEAGPNTLELATGFAFCRLVYTNISGTGTLGVTTVAGKRSAGQVEALGAPAPQLHDTSLGPLALWQLQSDGNVPAVLDVTDSAGAIGGPYDLSVVGAPGVKAKLGVGHSAGIQCFANQSERLEIVDTDFNLHADMTFAGVIIPTNVTKAAGWLIAWNAPTNAEADNIAFGLLMNNPGALQYLHENGAGVLNTFTLLDVGFVNGVPAYVGFTRSADGRTVKIFVNDKKVGQATLASAPTGGGNGTLAIGEEGPSQVQSLEGGLETFIIYDKELTETQMLSEFKKVMGVS